MPIKKHSNTLSVSELDSDTVLSIVTKSKKNHFSCTPAKLCEDLVHATYTSTGYFNAYVSLHPFIAIHIVGDKEILAQHKKSLIEKVTTALSSYHERGNVKIF
jgi:hypothetical protein